MKRILALIFSVFLSVAIMAYAVSAEDRPAGGDASASPPPSSGEEAPPGQEVSEGPAGGESGMPAEGAPEEAAKVEAAAETAEAATPAAAPEEGEAFKPGYVTVNFKGADIRTVLNYLSEVGGIDIVPSPDVTGTVDLKLTNKPWETALQIILKNYGYTYEREGDIIRVISVEKLKEEAQETKLFAINYAKAADVTKSVGDMLTSRGKVYADERTNAVMVTDIPTNIFKISQVIQKLDMETPQVLIEARIVETSLSDEEKLGIDWSLKITATGARRPTTLPFNRFNAPFGIENTGAQFFFPLDKGGKTYAQAQQVSAETTSDFPTDLDGNIPFPLADVDDFTYGTLDFTQFSAVLELLKSRADTHVVSNPRIATLNNKQATILIGETLNMPTYERNTTTGKMEITGYSPKDLGIKLDVTPHINEKSEITIDLKPELSELLRYDTLDAASGVKAPVFSTRTATTQVMVENGETIFIGGLIKEHEAKADRPVPFFGELLENVPVLGLLLAKKETTKKKTELILFMTVRLIKKGEELKGVPNAAEIYAPEYALYETPEEAKKNKSKIDHKIMLKKGKK